MTCSDDEVIAEGWHGGYDGSVATSSAARGRVLPPLARAHARGGQGQRCSRGTGRRGFLFALTNAREGGASATGYKSPDRREKNELGLSARSDGPDSLHPAADVRPAQQLGRRAGADNRPFPFVFIPQRSLFVSSLPHALFSS
ncbi:hypothetical protein VPH35_131526 [Triticum aestivum]